MPKLTDAERDDARRLAASFSAWGRPIGDMARYLARAQAELEALREFQRRVKALHDTASDLKLLDTNLDDLLAEHDCG